MKYPHCKRYTSNRIGRVCRLTGTNIERAERCDFYSGLNRQRTAGMELVWLEKSRVLWPTRGI